MRNGKDGVPEVEQDDVVTKPVVERPGSRIEHMTATLGPKSRYELTVAPLRPMANPEIYMSTTPRDPDVVAEKTWCGTAVIHGELSVESFRLGRATTSTFSRESPLRVLLSNEGTRTVSVSVSLADRREGDGAGTYRITKGEE